MIGIIKHFNLRFSHNVYAACPLLLNFLTVYTYMYDQELSNIYRVESADRPSGSVRGLCAQTRFPINAIIIIV